MVENSKNKDHFKVSTADKKWHFSADSEASRDEWVRTIKKVVFRCQNEGESVKVSPHRGSNVIKLMKWLIDIDSVRDDH